MLCLTLFLVLMFFRVLFSIVITCIGEEKAGLYEPRHEKTSVCAICEQQRCRSAGTSAQSDQAFVVHCLDSIIPLVFISKISSFYLASVAAQAGLCLTWLQTPKTGFLVMRFICFLCILYVYLA